MFTSLMLWGLLTSCSEDIIHIPNTTLRVGGVEQVEGTDLELRIFTEEGQCVDAGVKESEMKDCLPYVDRASGQVRIAFDFRYDSTQFEVPLTSEFLEVYHMGARVSPDQPPMKVEIIPHNPVRTPQLFILVIDASGSMNTPDALGLTRMAKVKEALLDKDVVKGFFPEEVKSAVVLLNFTAGKPVPVGTAGVEILKNQKRYKTLVRESLQPQGGYTHLYDAVEYATGELLQNEEIKKFLTLNDASPTIIVLTDGFNNLSAADTCGDNAVRLSRLLKNLRERRTGEGVELDLRPTVFSVGLGRPIRPRNTIEDSLKRNLVDVDPGKLCGKYAGSRIDGSLEKIGIDNASLEWIAFHGGGFSYIHQDVEGLGKAFQGAAAERFEWFELRYAVDQFYLRRAFESKLRLVAFATAEAKLMLYPSPWFDAPTGTPDESGWARPTPLRASAAVVMPILGILISVAFFGAAGFNTRRALFGRTRRVKPKAPPGGGPGAAPPAGGAG